ncbi:tRNA (adenosine(37)-N6)-threonylcarbamoyltransferase complex ATPase subunit type 1 TsaE [Larsenimonas rhizosphaerae]|uniref:tRNA threonylcarbamoyladenosine biosynthesis protein TsaE n=1 Tax=Larsenimonas rhizosphaerae TaxID=2944682 RepID=A0AA42CUH6_9GAMM|nr:tRNA (adenosine(37)-N6)-threonylcarbamoyltransferase complex ATPase subunit type 1 TsaE [Larsenimonas rhizosphaerae]MCM2132089.1 tRNA (adenosine(37)-N6)-threonylcarbamoyltransferase complex ATPase subunit type 1 TsaE [Larsenimonas rhizosphaerae]MCX2524692.1 tRNA (adenosine(37)-N6)-threonylcarbamoyltransferase complex ATPase subunit type 1 TsaE [Larsenimonas rhizosphaerae]
MKITLQDEAAQVAFGKQLGEALKGRGTLFLDGELGAGKTTLTRGLLRAYGYEGAVKSPTYTLMEPYELATVQLYHFDLYRLGDPEELEFVGARDVLGRDDAIVVVEWPVRGEGWLSEPDLLLQLEVLPEGRHVVIDARTTYGAMVIKALSAGT